MTVAPVSIQAAAEGLFMEMIAEIDNPKIM